jgi:hypothetical protein
MDYNEIKKGELKGVNRDIYKQIGRWKFPIERG